jgi:hypothetical protein
MAPGKEAEIDRAVQLGVEGSGEGLVRKRKVPRRALAYARASLGMTAAHYRVPCVRARVASSG